MGVQCVYVNQDSGCKGAESCSAIGLIDLAAKSARVQYFLYQGSCCFVCALLASVHALSPCLQRNEDICRLLQSAHLLLFHARAPAISGRQSTSPKALENLSLGWNESTLSGVFLVERQLFRLSA